MRAGNYEMQSFVSASISVQVHTSPQSSAFCFGVAFFCVAPAICQNSSQWILFARTGVVIVGTTDTDFRNQFEDSIEGYIAQAGRGAKVVSFGQGGDNAVTLKNA